MLPEPGLELSERVLTDLPRWLAESFTVNGSAAIRECSIPRLPGIPLGQNREDD